MPMCSDRTAGQQMFVAAKSGFYFHRGRRTISMTLWATYLLMSPTQIYETAQDTLMLTKPVSRFTLSKTLGRPYLSQGWCSLSVWLCYPYPITFPNT